MPPTVKVVICTHDRPQLLKRCLETLRHVQFQRYSTLVVDSAPTSPETLELSKAYGANYLLSPVIGLSRARNAGAEATGDDIIAFVDDDMELHPMWLRNLVDGFADDGVGAVTGPVLYAETPTVSDDELRALVDASALGSRKFEIDRHSRQWFERTNFGGAGDGNFALRRTAFERLGGFDERLGRGAALNTGEEHYAYFGLLTLGYKVAYRPEAIVFHPLVPQDRVTRRGRLAEAVGYSAFLAWNHPAYSVRVAGYLAGGTFGAKRPWRNSPPPGTASLGTAGKLGGAISGLQLFARSLVGSRSTGRRQRGGETRR